MAALFFGPGAPAQLDRPLAEPPPHTGKIAERLNWSAMIEMGRQHFPKAEVRSLSLPRCGNGLITLRMRNPEEWLPNGRTTLWFAADSGALVATRDAKNLPPAACGYNLLYPRHAAKVGGFSVSLIRCSEPAWAYATALPMTGVKSADRIVDPLKDRQDIADRVATWWRHRLRAQIRVALKANI